MFISLNTNRLVNGCIVFMCCSFMALWAAHSIGVNKQADSGTDPSPKSNGSRATIAHEVKTQAADTSRKDLEQTGKGADSGRVRSADYNPRLMREALRDPKFFRANLYYKMQKEDPFYADAYKMLEMDTATTEALRTLLGERVMAITMTVRDRIIDPKVREADPFGRQIFDTKANYDKKIADLLGPENYAMFSEYEETMTQRNQIVGIRQTLEFTGEPLTQDQEIAILPILQQAFASDQWASTMTRATSWDPSITTRVTSDQLKAMQAVLSEGQIKILTNLQKSQENMDSTNYPWKTIGRQMRESKQ